MRVVVNCAPQTGHLLPLIPLAQAFDARGDEVVIVSGPDVAEMVASGGLDFRAVGPSFDSWFTALRQRTRGNPGDGLDPSRVGGYFVPRLFGEIGMALVVDELLAFCAETRPDLLVFEPYSFAAPLVATITATPAVLHGIGPDMDPVVLDLVADAVSPIWREFGFDVPRAAGIYSGTALSICPPSLDPAGLELPEVQALRPAPLPLTEPPALSISFPDPQRPLVYLTLGTFSNNDLSLFRLVIKALEHEPVNVVATVGRNIDPSNLGPLPANARAERYIDQAHVLPHCSAVVHHAGAGTMFGVLAHGLPSLALPQSADNFINAHLLARAGAARTLMPGEVSETSVRSGLLEVLEIDTFRERARLLAHEIHSMPSSSDVAEILASRVSAR